MEGNKRARKRERKSKREKGERERGERERESLTFVTPTLITVDTGPAENSPYFQPEETIPRTVKRREKQVSARAMLKAGEYTRG